jgi:hypothetical protein
VLAYSIMIMMMMMTTLAYGTSLPSLVGRSSTYSVRAARCLTHRRR